MPRRAARSRPPVSRVPAWVPWVVGGAVLAYGVKALARPAGPIAGLLGGFTGTIFTIVIENRSASDVLRADGPMPFLTQLATDYAVGVNYRSTLRPSLPNYLLMTSGQDWGVRDSQYRMLPGRENLFAQLEAAGIPWRAYAEGMRAPCQKTNGATFAVRHNPALYFEPVGSDPALCARRVVDLQANLWRDLAADAVRYAWLAPSEVHNAHDAPPQAADRWLADVVPRLMQSPGYRRGGAIFILSDEPSFGSGPADPSRLVCVAVSPRARAGARVTTRFNHQSYLAGVEDLLGLPRLPAVRAASSLAELVGGA